MSDFDITTDAAIATMNVTHSCPDNNPTCQCQRSDEVCEIVLSEGTCTCCYDRIQEERKNPIRFLDNYSSADHSRFHILQEAGSLVVPYLDTEPSIALYHYNTPDIDYDAPVENSMPFPNGLCFIVPTPLLNLAGSDIFTVIISVHQKMTSESPRRQVVTVGVSLFIGGSDDALIFTPSIATFSEFTESRMSYFDEEMVAFIRQNLILMLAQVDVAIARFKSVNQGVHQKASNAIVVTSGSASRFMEYLFTALNASLLLPADKFEIESRSASSKYPITTTSMDFPRYDHSALLAALGRLANGSHQIKIRRVCMNIYFPSPGSKNITTITNSVMEYKVSENSYA